MQDPLPQVEDLERRPADEGPDGAGLDRVEALAAPCTTVEELRVAEAALRRQNERLQSSRMEVEDARRRYRDLFELAPDPYLVTDLAGIVREANEAAAAFLEVRGRFLPGKPLANFVADESRMGFRAELNRMGRPEFVGPTRLRLRLQPRHGLPRHCDAIVSLSRDRAGWPEGLCWLVRDVSAEVGAEDRLRDLNVELERRVTERTGQLQAELQGSERLILEMHKAEGRPQPEGHDWLGLVHGLDAIVWTADPATGRFTFVNERAGALLGEPASRWLAEPDFWASRLHPEDRHYVLSAWDRCREGCEDFEQEFRMLASDGRPVWFRASVRAVASDGRPREMRGLMVNITRRKKVERQLYAAKGELTSRLDDETYLGRLLARLTAISDPPSMFADILSAVCSIVGAEKGLVVLLDPVRGEGTLAASSGIPEEVARAVARAAGSWPLRGRIVGTAESVLIEDVLAVPGHEPYLDAIRAAGVRGLFSAPLLDVEPIGSVVAVFAEPHRPSDRQVRLVERYLRPAADMVQNARCLDRAREEARLREEFLAMLSHELRNPLASLAAALRLLGMPEADAPARAEALDVAGRQLGQLTRLVDDLLDASRIDREKLALRVRPVDAAEVARRAIETVGPLAAEKGHELAASLPSVPLWVAADPARLEQVLVNLLTNAVRYTDPGGRVVLSAARAADEVVLGVRDTGIGIAAEDLPRVFDLFAQAGPASARGQAGLGIGLALVRGLVELQGGRVEARSPGPGRGCEFVVTLPAGSPPPAPDPGGPDAQPEAGSRPRDILLVDDDPDSAKLLARLLATSGHRVAVAHDGPSALAQADHHPPEVAVLDLSLPGMDGFELARLLRDLYADLRLIALTGLGRDDDRRRSREAGFDDHLVKPVDLDELLDVLARNNSDSPLDGPESTR